MDSLLYPVKANAHLQYFFPKRLRVLIATSVLLCATIYSLSRVTTVIHRGDQPQFSASHHSRQLDFTINHKTELHHLCDDLAAKSLRFCILQALLRRDPAIIRRLQGENNFYISVCTPVKNAGDLLHEFIVRNYLAGVDHFFIYDNNGNSAFENIGELLEPLSPLITFVEPPSYESFTQLINRTGEVLTVKNQHHHMLNWHCFMTHGSSSKWMLSIDADEYLEAKQPQLLDDGGIKFEHVPFMRKFLEKIENDVPAQIGRWNTVLTNGLMEPELDKITLHDKYPMACGRKDTAPNPKDFNYLFASKAAVQPKLVDYPKHREIGDFFLHGVRHWWDHGKVVKDLYFSGAYKNYTIPFSSAESEWEVVHYWSRSFGDYLLKRDRGRLNMPAKVKAEDLMTRENACRDHGMLMRPPGIERRNYLVRYLLTQIDEYKEIQKTYHDEAIRCLNATWHQVSLRQYEHFLKGHANATK